MPTDRPHTFKVRNAIRHACMDCGAPRYRRFQRCAFCLDQVLWNIRAHAHQDPDAGPKPVRADYADGQRHLTIYKHRLPKG